MTSKNKNDKRSVLSLPQPSNNPHRLNWERLKKFYYVEQMGSLIDAAAYLNTTSPALSRVLQELERSLGRTLFKRSKGVLTLTLAGEKALQEVTKAFSMLEGIQRQLNDDHDNPQGLIRIWADHGLLSLCLMNYLQGFIHQYPNIHLAINATQAIPNFDLFEADVAIRPPVAERHDITQIPLMACPVKLYASPSYLKTHVKLETLEDLDQHRLIAFGDPLKSDGFHHMNWHLTLGTKPGHMRSAFMTINSLDECLRWAAMGLGLVTSLAQPSMLQHYQLVEVLNDIPSPSLQYHSIYSSHSASVKRIQLLHAYLIPYFKQDFGDTEDKTTVPLTDEACNDS